MPSPFNDPLPPDTLVRDDTHRVTPYLMRYYASVNNPRASVLADGIFDSLIGQIIWPRGSLRRATAVVKAHDHPASGALPEFLREAECDEDEVNFRVMPTNDVDAKLAQLGDFKSGLKRLYSDDPAWLRGVLRNSLRAAEARQNEADGLMWTHLQQVGEVFAWTPAELQLARIAMHAADIADLAEWLDTLPNAGRDAARAYKRVLTAGVPTLRQSLLPKSHLSCCGLFIVDRPHNRPLGLSDPPRLHPKLMAAIGEADFHVKQLSRFLFSSSPNPTLGHPAGTFTSTSPPGVGTLTRATNFASHGATGTRW